MGWWQTVLPFGIALLTILLPGALIGRCSGVRGLRLAAVSGPLTISLVAVVAITAPRVGIPLTPIIVAIATAVLALVALLTRAGVLMARSAAPKAAGHVHHPQRSAAQSQSAKPRDYPLLGSPPVTTLIITVSSLVLPAVLIGSRYMRGIGNPEDFSQTYDNIYHLNAVATILETGNGSSLTLGGLTPDSSNFYPAAFHDITVVVLQAANVDVPMAVNITTIIIGALIWPLSCLYLVSRITGGRLLPMMLTGVLCAAFTAFPYLMIDFGALYPNHLAIAILPLALGLTIDVLGIGSEPRTEPLGSAALLLGVLPGMAFAHPSVVVAFIGFSLPLVLAKVAQQIVRRRRRTVPSWAPIVWVLIAVAYIVVAIMVWIFVRPGPDTATWQPVQSAAQAMGEILTGAPMGTPASWLILILIAFGLYDLVRERRQWWIFGMFLVGSALFIIASSMPFGDVRSFWVGVWYNDNFRLAALLPVVTLPIVVVGAEYVIRRTIEIIRARIRSLRDGKDFRRPGLLYGSISLALIIVVCVASQNTALAERQDSLSRQYSTTDESPILKPDQRKLFERVADYVPPDERVIGNPNNGSSLVLALAGRGTTAPHVTGSRTPDELTMIDHWDEAAYNTSVCPAVQNSKTWWALDIEDHEIAPVAPFRGLERLDTAPGIELVAQEGEAKLYRMNICRNE